MNLSIRTLALASAAVVLASCGGGGGDGGAGGTPIGPGAQAVIITEANAKPVAANALANARNTSAVSGATDLPLAVQTQAAGITSLQAISRAVRLATTSLPAAALPQGVAISETVQCPQGGSLSLSGNVASSAGLVAGDNLTLVASNCQVSEGGVTTLLNGQLALAVLSGEITTVPFHVVISVSANNFSVQSGGVTAVSSGDARLDWSLTTSTSESLVATGTELTSRQTVGSVTRTTTIRNYTHAVTFTGTRVSTMLAASVQSDSTRLGATGGSYTMTTRRAVEWDVATGVVNTGEIQVVGTNNSQLVLTLGAGNTAAIQLDANGDGAFERSITTDVAELSGLF